MIGEENKRKPCKARLPFMGSTGRVGHCVTCKNNEMTDKIKATMAIQLSIRYCFKFFFLASDTTLPLNFVKKPCTDTSFTFFLFGLVAHLL